MWLICLQPFMPVIAQDWHDRYRKLDVQKYDISLRVSDTSDMIYGKTRVDIEFRDSVTCFVLDLAGGQGLHEGMHVDSLTFGGHVPGYIHRNDSLLITIPSMDTGDTGSCTVSYHGFPDDGLIISRNRYGDRTFFTENWPHRAHHWFPCVDHPSDKALAGLHITAPSHYQVIASGIPGDTIFLPGDMTCYEWHTEVPFATKIIATGIAEFKIMKYGEAAGVPVTGWVYPQDREAGFYDYAVAPGIVEYFVSRLGPYPFGKMAFVQSTTRYGGMENAGNIFFPETSVTGRRENILTMVHETAHMWFGNSAGEMDWPDIWLSEGFATYLTDLFVEDNSGEDVFRSRMEEEREEVIRFAKERKTPVVDTTFRDPEELLNANSYEKGAWVLHMLRHKLGDELFMKGIRTYYNRYMYGNATTAGFQNVMEEVSGMDLELFFRQWLYSPGLPVLGFHVRRKHAKILITVEQKQGSTVFNFPLDLAFIFPGGEKEKVTLNIEDRIQSFTFHFRKDPEKITTDPDTWLLSVNRPWKGNL